DGPDDEPCRPRRGARRGPGAADGADRRARRRAALGRGVRRGRPGRRTQRSGGAAAALAGPCRTVGGPDAPPPRLRPAGLLGRRAGGRVARLRDVVPPRHHLVPGHLRRAAGRPGPGPGQGAAGHRARPRPRRPARHALRLRRPAGAAPLPARRLRPAPPDGALGPGRPHLPAGRRPGARGHRRRRRADGLRRPRDARGRSRPRPRLPARDLPGRGRRPPQRRGVRLRRRPRRRAAGGHDARHGDQAPVDGAGRGRRPGEGPARHRREPVGHRRRHGGRPVAAHPRLPRAARHAAAGAVRPPRLAAV
ncbi:MAG: hypothetical protein AVDCRST_MAG06-1360, partial [uncultured Nocardioides sp.]